MIEALGAEVLHAGVRARFVDGVNGLRVHLLEAGDPGQKTVLLLHGFPELAYSWRKVMPALAAVKLPLPPSAGTVWSGASNGFESVTIQPPSQLFVPLQVAPSRLGQTVMPAARLRLIASLRA